jgi:hypothetical protein
MAQEKSEIEHPGLFMVRVARPGGMPPAAQRLEPPAMRRERTQGAPSDLRNDGFHRYCSGCAHETEHVAWAADGRGSIPSIRWPTAQPAIGTTTCLTCGQWRAATTQPRPPSWSCWPRASIATRSLSSVPDLADSADDLASERAAENEGMPPQPEPRRPRRRSSSPPRRVAVAR